MKKIITLFVLILLIGVQNSFAQKRIMNISPEELSAKLTEKMKSEFNLSNEQAEKLKAVHLKFAKEMQAKLQGVESKTEFFAKRQELKALRKAKEAELKAIFTDEQFAQFEAKKQERKGKMMQVFQNRKQIKEFMQSDDFQKLKAELKAYKTQNIQPVMFAQRNKLEAQLSENDKQQIAEIRQALKAQKPKIKALRDKIKASKELGKIPNESDIQALKGLKDKNKEKMTALNAIATKYANQLQVLSEEIAPQKEQWKNDLKKIAQKYLNQSELKDLDLSKMTEKISNLKNDIGKPAFLLMKADKQNIKNETRTPSQVFPNPSDSYSNITFELSEGSNVKIELKDKEGILLQNILNEYKTSGKHSVQLNTKDLATGLYFYTITDSKGTQTKRFFVQK